MYKHHCPTCTCIEPETQKNPPSSKQIAKWAVRRKQIKSKKQKQKERELLKDPYSQNPLL